MGRSSNGAPAGLLTCAAAPRRCRATTRLLEFGADWLPVWSVVSHSAAVDWSSTR